MARLVAYANTVLDRADRMPWLPPVAGLSLGAGIGQVVLGRSWGWALLAAGLLFGAIRPLGTSLRNRRRLSEAKKLLRAAREGDSFSMLAAEVMLDQVERSLGMRRNGTDA